jgi:hypothetical protein
MSKKTIITCLCDIEIDNANEYEALTVVEEMLKREYPLSEKITLRINKTLTSTSEGCGVTYKKEENGNVRRDNGAERVFAQPTEQRRREAVG